MATRIGIISDTHMPLRWDRLHDSIPGIFAGVDLILHAGDVGELWVLDELSRIAPVVAVHGNDETEASVTALPFHQTLMIEGHRLVLNHGARRDPVEEQAIRAFDDWQSKFDYLANYAAQLGGEIMVSGHLHIPMVVQHNGILIVNPGALAGGGGAFRQRIQTVAIMTLERGVSPIVTHHDLNAGGALHVPNADYSNGLQWHFMIYSESILAPDLRDLFNLWVKQVAPQTTAEWHALTVSVRPILIPHWRGEKPPLTVEQFALAAGALPDPVLQERLRLVPEFARLLTEK